MSVQRMRSGKRSYISEMELCRAGSICTVRFQRSTVANRCIQHQSGTAEAIHEFVLDIQTISGLTLDMGFPTVNEEAIDALRAEGFTQIEFSHVNVMKLENYQKRKLQWMWCQ